MGLILGIAAVCVPAAPVVVQGRGVGGADADKAAIRISGPLVAKPMMEGLAGEFRKAKGPAGMKYMRMEGRPAAVRALAAGYDMVLTLGKVTERDLGYSRSRWKALKPQEHIIAARATAVVVHARNPVDSLTRKQLWAIFSRQAKDWKVFGGAKKSIRRYGLPPYGPLGKMFHGRIIPAGRCRMILRRKDSQTVLKAVASDPQAIAFVDAVPAMSAGDSVKIVALGAAAASSAAPAARPNAQTIKDGAYPLAETVVLYVSAKASPAAQDLAEFIVSGEGGGVYRKNGFLPTLGVVRADVLAAFEKLYGPDVKRVKATAAPADDLALARKLIGSARTMDIVPELLAAMCEAAHDLAASVSGGETLAFEALEVLAVRVPDKRFDCALRRSALYRQAYQASKRQEDGKRLIETLVVAADVGTSAHRFAEAAEALKQAVDVSKEANSPRLAAIEKRLPAFVARAAAAEKAAALAVELRSNPKDVKARSRMLELQLIELDDPVRAARYVDAADEESFKTNIPLAIEPLEKLSTEATLQLAEWYVDLMGRAGVGGKELMATHARKCYTRFFKLHAGRGDALAIRASLGIQKVGGKPPAKPPKTTGGRPSRGKPTLKATLKPGELMTDLKLAEFVAANPKLTRLTFYEVGAASEVTSLGPVARLKRLTRVNLHNVGKVRDLSPLSKLPKLTDLSLQGLRLEDISALSALSKLTFLKLVGSKNISDITAVGRMTQLRLLDLTRCSKVTDLTPLAKLKGLKWVNISGCSVSDVSPLTKSAKNLTSLNMRDTEVKNVTPLARLTRLKTLDLRGCDVSADDLAWLRKQLPACKVLADKPGD